MKKTSKKKPLTNYILGMGGACIGTEISKNLPIAMLDFTNINKMGKVGDDVPDDSLTGPVARLVFLNELGFDNLIERVTELREQFLAKQKEYNASINISIGCTDKQRKSPRKGKAPGVHNASPSKRRRRSGKSK